MNSKQDDYAVQSGSGNMGNSTEKQKRNISITFIRPENERVKNLIEAEIRDKEEKERQKEIEKNRSDRLKQLETKKTENEEEKKRQQQQQNLDRDSELQVVYKKVNETEGNLFDIFRDLKNNVSPFQIDFAGLDLNETSEENFLILMYLLMDNKSLHTLNLSRKKLGDKHASLISEMLKSNKTLKRLELEGNNFGPESAKHFAEALEINKTLRYLDLENNNIGKKMIDNNDKNHFEEKKSPGNKIDDHDSSGVKKLFSSLKKNTMLISLNLNNNYLNTECCDYIIDCLESNNILIHLDIGLNQMFEKGEEQAGEKKYTSKGLKIDSLIVIKNSLNKNREIYKKYRQMEWQERKKLGFEEDEVFKYTTTISGTKVENEISQNDKIDIESYYLNKFKAEVDQMEAEFTENVNLFMSKTRERLSKKKKPRAKKKK